MENMDILPGMVVLFFMLTLASFTAAWHLLYRGESARRAAAAEKASARPGETRRGRRRTGLSISGDMFLFNGKPSYKGKTWRGRSIEGLLLNARLVQGTFDDLNPETRGLWAYPDTGTWDPERNTREFISALPGWRDCGLNSFTVNLQGGMPKPFTETEQPWHNSALTETGELRPDYLSRLEKILDRADELGMAVILGVYYFGQDRRMRDEQAVMQGLDNAVDWVLDGGWTNVLLEVNNECDVHYHHPILQPGRVDNLIIRAQNRRRGFRRLLVGTSYGGGQVPRPNVVEAADFLLLHGNGVGDPNRIAEMVRETRQVRGYTEKPVLFNEDDHYGFEQPHNNLTAALAEYAGWGYYDQGEGNYRDGFQSPPVNWSASSDRKRAFFGAIRDITGGGI
jgi:hypothetical protein